jgi:hypothetical protein
MIEWMLVMIWATAPDQPQQRQVIYGPGQTYSVPSQADCEYAAYTRQKFLWVSDWPYKPYTRFVCEAVPK